MSAELTRDDVKPGDILYDLSDEGGDARWVVTTGGIYGLAGGAEDWTWAGLAANGGFGTLRKMPPSELLDTEGSASRQHYIDTGRHLIGHTFVVRAGFDMCGECGWPEEDHIV